MREACGDAAGHHGDAADSQRGDAVQCSDGERAVLRQRTSIRGAAVAKVLLVNRQLAAGDVQAIDGDWVVVVVNLQNQIGAAAIAVGISDGVGEGLCAVTAAGQGFEIGIAGIERVGVSAVGVQNQGAVSTGERAGRNRACRYAVGTLHVVGKHVAGQGQQGFRGNAVGVVKRFWHVVGDVHVKGAGGAVAIAVGGDYGELFAEIVHAIAGRVGFVAVEGVAVADRASGRVITGDGQGIAQLRGDRLGKADRHAANNYVDAADAQAVQTIRCRDREAATLRQRAWIGRCTVRQIGFIEVQLAARRVEAVEDDRIVHRWRWHHDRRRRVVTIVDVRVATILGKFGNAIETGSGETDDRIDPAADFGQ